MRLKILILSLAPLALYSELPQSLCDVFSSQLDSVGKYVLPETDGYYAFPKPYYVFTGARFTHATLLENIGRVVSHVHMETNFADSAILPEIRGGMNDLVTSLAGKFGKGFVVHTNETGLIDGYSVKDIDTLKWDVEIHVGDSNGVFVATCDFSNDLHKSGRMISCEDCNEASLDPSRTNDFRPLFAHYTESGEVLKRGALDVIYNWSNDVDFDQWCKRSGTFKLNNPMWPFVTAEFEQQSNRSCSSSGLARISMRSEELLDGFDEAIGAIRSLHFYIGKKIPHSRYVVRKTEDCYEVAYPNADRFGWSIVIFARKTKSPGRYEFGIIFERSREGVVDNAKGQCVNEFGESEIRLAA